MLDAVSSIFSPLLPDDYLEVIDRLWSTRDSRQRPGRHDQQLHDWMFMAVHRNVRLDSFIRLIAMSSNQVRRVRAELRRWSIAAFAAVAFLMGGWPAVAAAQGPQGAPPCSESTFVECGPRIGYLTTSYDQGVRALLDIRDTSQARALYRRLIGPRFEMPALPQVRLLFIDARLGTYTPGVQDAGPTKYDSRYLEVTMSLRVKYGVREGWRDLRIALNNRVGFELGRSGFAQTKFLTTLPKFLAQMLYEQDPLRTAGYATAAVDGSPFVRVDWEPTQDLPNTSNGLQQDTRLGDGTENGLEWDGTVGRATYTSFPGVPAELLSGQQVPTGNPTALPPAKAVRLRVRLAPELDRFNTSAIADRSVLDNRPLPRLFGEGESLASLMDVDQEVTGQQFGPYQQFTVVEGEDITADATEAPRSPSTPAAATRRAALSVRLAQQSRARLMRARSGVLGNVRLDRRGTVRLRAVIQRVRNRRVLSSRVLARGSVRFATSGQTSFRLPISATGRVRVRTRGPGTHRIKVVATYFDATGRTFVRSARRALTR